jgi:hypothetical protein
MNSTNCVYVGCNGVMVLVNHPNPNERYFWCEDCERIVFLRDLDVEEGDFQ